MQNSLFRRRLAVRACFDILIGRELVPSTRTTDDMATSLITRQPFVSNFYFEITAFSILT